MQSHLSVLLIGTSLAVLVLGGYLWRLTGQRVAVVHTLFGSFGLLFAAFEAVNRSRPEWSYVLPFFTAMLFGGRAVGAWWRSRKEHDYRRPAEVLTTVTAMSMLMAVVAYFSV